MSSIIVAGSLISFIVVICFILVSINITNREKKAMELVYRFNDFGKKNNLSFSHKEKVENFIIGMDEVHMKLIVLRKADNQYDFQAVDLKCLKSCSNKKISNSINMGTKKKEKYESLIDKIALQFDYLDNRPPIEIVFYDVSGDHELGMSELEEKAGSWLAILNQTIKSKVKSTA